MELRKNTDSNKDVKYTTPLMELCNNGNKTIEKLDTT